MSVIVFLGPTLARDEAERVLPATYLPPVSLGDVYTAARRRPRAIAIVDGYFDRVPAVWHKEILWALARGVHVYGASSMGALRAAELEAFGMVGVGRIFEAFRDGVLEDDDEVAVIHGPSAVGFVPGSEALVNMRATFSAARDAGAIDAATHDLVLEIARQTYYPARDYGRVLDAAEAAGVAPARAAALREWCAERPLDLKRADALDLLERVAADLARDDGPKQVAFTFHVTSMWEDLRNTVDARPLDDRPGVEAGLDEDLIDELRLAGADYERERDRSMIRMFAIAIGHQQGVEPAPLARHLAAERVREANGASSQGTLDDWLRRQQLTPAAFQRLVADEAQATSVAGRYRGLLPLYLYDHLRVTGRYGDLARRARDKHAALWKRGLHNPGVGDAGITEPALWSWFFEEALGRPLPEDLAAAAAALDYGDLDMMRRAALRELLYRRHLDQAAERTASRAGLEAR